MFVSLKRDEFAFREVFGVDGVRRQFVSDVTGIPLQAIRSVRIVSPILRKRTRKQKLGILDLALTYLSHLYVDELWTGEDYDKLKKSITRCIL